jgi:hypothetical protein
MSETPLSKDACRRLHQELFGGQADRRVYAVLDGASIKDLLEMLAERQPEHVCLYRGELAPDLAAMAPYLVRLEPDSVFTDWVLGEGWGGHWGIFALTDADLTALRKHFRRFLMVKSPEGRRVYFRYYDPRVLRTFLPTCNAEELAELFGPVEAYICEDEDPSTGLQMWRDGGELHTEEISVKEPSES